MNENYSNKRVKLATKKGTSGDNNWRQKRVQVAITIGDKK